MNQKLFIGIACLIIGFVAGWLVNGWRLSASSTTEKLSAVQANADHFRGVTKKVNTEAKQYLGNSEQLEKKIAELKRELANAKKNHPVPADCRPDDDRLRVLRDAVTAANTTVGQ